MAYNLQPLIQTLDQILHPHLHPHRRPNWILDPSKEPLLQYLFERARFLTELFENLSSITSHAVRSLESQIRDAAYHALNVIEYHMADQLLSNKYTKRITFSPPDLLQEIANREFEPIFDKLVDMLDGIDTGSGPSSSDLASSGEDLNRKNIVVGISDDVIQLKEQRLIMARKSKLEIIPIVGMGGIGKTTLAQILYNDQCVVSYFDTRAWIVISQRYSEREMLLDLLKCITGNLSTVHHDGNADPGLQLYKSLFGRRYLVVLDDMWSGEAWDSIKMFFPDEKNGSRILVTTRELNVANYVAGSENLHHQMKLLNEDESWKLLQQKVFSEGSYALELEEIGKNIAKNCRGLPLAIHVVGGVLSPLEKIQEAWLRVAKDLSSSINHGQMSNILSLSYNHLPNYLKPCFLYMGAFREDRQIQASRLIKLWMAEGFLKPSLGMNFEETAGVYLKELVERNLVSVAQQETKRKAKGYIMHDLLRDLCIKKSQEEKFLYVGPDAIKDLNQNEMLRLRLSVHDSYDKFVHIIGSPYMPSAVCSILFFAWPGDLSWLDKYAFGLMRLLKVLDMLEAEFAELPRAIQKLVNLRYLAACITNSDSYSISNLCNLQTLIFRLKESSSPIRVKELLDMSQLRHIKFKGHYPLFSLHDGESVDTVNEELQTLSGVVIDNSFPRILKVIPNLKKLGILLRISTIDLSSLSQLQILKCSRYSEWSTLNLIFPPSLKKLTLHKCQISSEFLNEIGRLPNLQVLKVIYCDYDYEQMWKPTEGEFQQLRLLVLEKFSGLKKWIADETHYPRLEHLIISECDELEEIPSDIGDIPTLEIIEVHDSSISCSVEKSARKIQEEQLKYGNDTLQLCLTAPLRLRRILKELETIEAALMNARAALGDAIITLGRATRIWRRATVTLEDETIKLETATETLSRVTEPEAMVGVEVEASADAEAEAEAILAEAAAAVAEATTALMEADATHAMARAAAKEDKAMAGAKATLPKAAVAATANATRAVTEASAKAAMARASATLIEEKTMLAGVMVGGKAAKAEEKAASERASVAVAKAKAVGTMARVLLVNESAMARAKAELAKASTTTAVAEAIIDLATAATQEMKIWASFGKDVQKSIHHFKRHFASHPFGFRNSDNDSIFNA